MKIKRITSAERKMCLGKTKHKSELAAKHHLEELRKFSKTPSTLNYYQCTFCIDYHVGNNSRYD